MAQEIKIETFSQENKSCSKVLKKQFRSNMFMKQKVRSLNIFVQIISGAILRLLVSGTLNNQSF